MKKKQYNKACLFYGLVIGIILGLFFWVIQCVRYVLSDVIEEEYSTLDVSNYGVWDGHIENEQDDIKSKLVLFPTSVENAIDAEYYYSCGKYSSSSNYYVIYSKMSYTDENYKEELQRISEIEYDVYLKQKKKQSAIKFSIQKNCLPIRHI